jgi:glycosyltransferase involved in cell wall biosynthesis
MGKKVVAKVAAANLGTEAGSLSGNYGFLGNLLARLVLRVDAFVAISDEIRDGLLRDDVPSEQIHNISNFIDPEIFYPPALDEKVRLKAKFGYAENPLLLFAGRLVPRKGVEYLLEAWQEVCPYFQEARLLLLGDGPLLKHLKETAFRLDIEGTCRFAGRVDNVAEYLRAADIFVLPSLQEGLSNSLLEAMATRLPVVATRIGGVVDVIRDGENGLLVAPSSGRELAAGIRAVLGDAALGERLAWAAMETIRASYGLESRVARYKDLYESCFMTRKGTPPR